MATTNNIYSKFLYSETLANYTAANTKTPIPDDVIAFVGDDHTIRTQGKIFGGYINIDGNVANIFIGGTTATVALDGHSHNNATATMPGFMSPDDKKKLDSLEDGIQLTGETDKYLTANGTFVSLPTASSDTLGLVKAGANNGNNYGVSIADDGSMTVGIPVMTGATSSANGKSGTVPTPTKSQVDYFLKGNGTWSALPSGSGSVGTSGSTDWKTIVNYVSLSGHTLSGATVSIPVATSTQDGYMSSGQAAALNTATSDISTLKSSLTTGMHYKGGISAIPAKASVGDVYRCDAAISGVNAEVGDFIVCKTATTTATNSAWDIWNVNVTGAAYIDSNVVTDGHVASFDGTTGKLKDSGFTIPSNAVFTDSMLKVSASTATTNCNIILAANTSSAAQHIYSAKASINPNTGIITAGGLTLASNGSSTTFFTTDGGTLSKDDLLSGYALASNIKNSKHIIKIGSSTSNQALSNDFTANASSDVTTYIPLATGNSSASTWGAIKGNYGDTTGFTKALVVGGEIYYKDTNTDTNTWRNIQAKITGASTVSSTYTNTTLTTAINSGALKFNSDFMVSGGEVSMAWSIVAENGAVSYR